MTAAAEIRSSAVRAINEESCVFQVKGRGKDTWYQLNFSGSSPSQLPQCQCFDWTQNLLPCKQFIAVMREYPEWNWARFPESYRESPFITLDHVRVAKILPSVENLEGHEDFAMSSELQFKNLPTCKPNHRSKATACKEVLKEMKSLAYVVYDEELLVEITNSLEELMIKLKMGATYDDRIIVENEKDVTRLRSTIMSPSEQSFQNGKHQKTLDLPLRQGKRPGSGRVGIAAETAKRATKLDVRKYLEEKPAKCSATVQEEAYFDSMYEFYEQLVQESKAKDEDHDPCVTQNIAEEVAMETDSKVPNVTRTKKQKSCHDEIEITCVKSGPENAKKIERKLQLTMGEIKTIEENHMLTDESINILQNILSNMFPDLKGFQDTVIGATLTFDIVPQESEFIQILHDRDLHWVCISHCLNPHKKGINLYDSLSNGAVPNFVKKQIASMMHIKEQEMHINIVPVKQQMNLVDCGVFAIAFATCLAFGKDPTRLISTLQPCNLTLPDV